MTITLCADSPIPTFNALYDALLASLPAELPSFNVPSLLALLNPIYDGFAHLPLELSQLIQELQNVQLNTTLMALIEPLVSFLGGALEDLLPKIPHTDLTLLDILSSQTDAIYTAVKVALEQGFTFPFVPNPIFGSISIPAIEAVNTVKMVLRGYQTLLVTLLTDLIEQVTELLLLEGLPALPTIPSLSEVKALILAAFPNFDDIEAIFLSGVDISALFATLSLAAGLPPLILPQPLFDGLSNFDIEFNEALSIFYSHAITAVMSVIVDFVQNILSMLSFNFPLLCISF